MFYEGQPVLNKKECFNLLYNILGVDGFTTEEDQELLSRIEKQIKRRFIIGSQVSEHAIIQDFARQVIRGNHLRLFFPGSSCIYTFPQYTKLAVCLIVFTIVFFFVLIQMSFLFLWFLC